MRIAYDDDDLRALASQPGFHLPRYSADLERAFRKAIGLLESASSQAELRNFKGLRLEQLKGELKGFHSVRLNKQWRLILEFTKNDLENQIIVIKIVDYH